MSSINESSEPLENFTDEQLSDLVKSNDALDLEEARMLKEEIEEQEREKSQKKPFRKLKRSPLEVINRTLFFVFFIAFST